MVCSPTFMFKKQKINILLIVLILIGSFFTVMTMFRSGLTYDFGIGFWGPNGHDAIWHLSLINQLKQNIPPKNPIFSGTILNNYHIGFDLITAAISNLLNISSSTLYFRILPIIFAILIGLLSYSLAYLITKNKNTSLIFVFLNYFAGSFGWIVTLIKSGSLGGESLFWSMQSASTLLNPPFSLSIIFLFSGLILWLKHKDSESIFWPILIGLIFGLLSLIKIYPAVLIGLAFSCFWLINFFKKNKNNRFNFIICLSTLLVSLVIFYLLNLFKGQQILEFHPFWFTNSLIQSIDKFYWPKLASFKFNQTNFLISILIQLFLIALFLIGNLGIRVLGFFSLAKKVISKKISSFDQISFFILFFSFTIPLFFVQKGTAWNTIQFFYFFLLFANFYLAIFLSNLFAKKKILAILLLVLSIITSISTFRDYFGNPPPAAIPLDEAQALDFLKSQPNGIVLTFPYDQYQKNNYPKTPIPIYAYETTAYVSAFSNKVSFLEDEMNLDITGFDWKSRRLEEQQFFTSSDKFFTRGFLLNNNIDYIYLVNDQSFKVDQNDLQIDLIFNNSSVKIYQVRK
ncbi:MAG: hypothetical protein WDA13_03625 [Candidatus Shapirobacteria bacterium]